MFGGGSGSGSHIPKEETLRLEGFAESLKGHRVFCVASTPKFAETFLRGRVAALDAEMAHRGRKILVLQGTAAAAAQQPRWLTTLGWDAMFHVRDVSDLKLALTHIQHAARPVRVFWVGGEPQAAVMTALARMDGVTVVAMGERTPSSSDAWQAIFWAPDAAVEEVEVAVAARQGAAGTGQLRAVCKELRASDVGLIWSAIGESDPRRGGLYWYDPQEGSDLQPALDMGEAAETLRKVADMLVEQRGGGR